MTLDELIKIADAGYGEGLVETFARDPDANAGDGLARFVALELSDVYDSTATREELLTAATSAMWTAIADLERVIAALEAAHG